MASDELPKPTLLKRVPLGHSRRRLNLERHLRIWLYVMGIPMFALSLYVLNEHGASFQTMLICALSVILFWALAVSSITEQIAHPLRTLTNVVSALREEDYSFRVRGGRRDDAFGDLASEVNALAGMLQSQRTGALEAMALLERVMAAMESPLLAFDLEGRLLMLNAGGEHVFGTSSEYALGKSAEELNLAHLLATEDGERVVLQQNDPQADRWIVKRSSFRMRGVRHTLLMLSDVSKALREEERVAWERLIRVLGHEINNSLTPIKSIAGSLRARLVVTESASDFERGLAVIENRAESLNRFLQAYRQLMKLPAPTLKPISLVMLISRVVHLEARLPITILASEDAVVFVDADLIEQALINLVRNAVDAALSSDEAGQAPSSVELRWERAGPDVIIFILDNGLGLTNAENLFVPFYTTKPGGTGIGLVLAQQIAEAHSGSVRLTNRTDSQGCIAELRLACGEDRHSDPN